MPVGSNSKRSSCLPALDLGVGRDVQQLPGHPVVRVVQPAILDVEREAARGGALREQHALGARLGDLDVGGDAVRAVEHPRAGEERHRLRARVVDEPVARRGDQRLLAGHAARRRCRRRASRRTCRPPRTRSRSARSAGRGARRRGRGSRPGPRRRGRAPSPWRRARASVSAEIGSPNALAGLGERRARPRAHRPPAVVVDRPVAHHLEVLRRARGSPPPGRRRCARSSCRAAATAARRGSSPAARCRARRAPSGPCR